MKKKKRKFVYVIVALIFFSCFYGRFDIASGFKVNVAYAESSEEEEIEKELEEEISSQLSNLDFSDVESVLDTLTVEARTLFSSESFLDKVNYVISGEYAESSESFFSAVTSIFWKDLKNYLPIIATIISVAILGGMVSALRPVTGGKSIGNVVHFVTYGVILVFLGTTITQIVTLTQTTLTSIKGMFDGIFPILLTLLTALGGSVSVGIYQPAIALLGNLFVSLITYFLLPLFIFSIVFSIVGNLSQNTRLDKFVSFLQSLFKWTI